MIKLFYTYNKVESESFIKKVLETYCGKELEIKRTQNGKPYVDYPVYFSLSHSDEITVCGVSEENVGVDAERIRPVPKKDAISRKFLQCSESLDDASFITKWTEFESKVKFYGETILNCPSVKTGKLITKSVMINDYVISVSSDIKQEIELEMI